MIEGTVGSLLFRMSHEGLSGGLRVDDATIVVRGGKVLSVQGVPGLLDSLGERMPDPATLSHELATDVPVCLAQGLALDEVFQAASKGLGTFLADVDADDAVFDPTEQPPPGSFPLPKTLLRLYIEALSTADPDSIARAYQGREKEPLRVMIRPEDAEGLGPVVLRCLRAAWRSGNLRELVQAAGTSPQRLRQTWTSLDLLARMGLVVVGEEFQEPERGTQPQEAPPPDPEPESSGDDDSFDAPNYAFDFDRPDEPKDDEPNVLSSLDEGGEEVFALGSGSIDFDDDNSEHESDENEDGDEIGGDERDAAASDELSELESDDEASDVFAMDSWDDDDELEDQDSEEDDHDEDTVDPPSSVTIVEDDEDDPPDNPLAALMQDDDPAVKAMALFYSELLRAGPLAPLGLRDEDLVGYLTLEILRIRANRALGRWHPELHRHRSPKAQQAAMELYKLVESRFEQMSSLETLAEAIAQLRRRRPFPRPSQDAHRKAEMFYRRAQKLAEANAWAPALVLVGKAVELAAVVPKYRILDLHARSTMDEMSAESAVVNLDALTVRPTDHASVNYTAGRIWEDAKRPARALERYERALSHAPEHEEAAWRREQLLAGGAGEDTGASFVGLLSGLFSRS